EPQRRKRLAEMLIETARNARDLIELLRREMRDIGPAVRAVHQVRETHDGRRYRADRHPAFRSEQSQIHRLALLPYRADYLGLRLLHIAERLPENRFCRNGLSLAESHPAELTLCLGDGQHVVDPGQVIEEIEELRDVSEPTGGRIAH